MALVEPRLLDSLARPTYPTPNTVKAMNSLDQDMDIILRNTTLSDEAKVQRYQHVLERYLTFHDQYQQGQRPTRTTPTPAAPTTTTPAKTPPSNRLEEAAILESIPPTLRRKATLLLQRVKQSDALGWNDRGELTVDGTAVPNSNMIDLMNDALRERQHFQPTGRAVFARGLRAMNIPRDWVRNKIWWDETVQEDVKREPTTATNTPQTVKPSSRVKLEPLNTAPPGVPWWDRARTVKDEPSSSFKTWLREKLSPTSPDGKITTTPRRTRQQRRPGLRPTPSIRPPQAWSPY